MKSKLILVGKYTEESMIDLEDHMRDMDTTGIPLDENGFCQGVFYVTVEWVPEEPECENDCANCSCKGK